MSRRIKLSVEEKIIVVNNYLSGELGQSECERKYGIHNQTLYDWVRQYKVYGIEGLYPKTSCRRYSPEIKVRAVEEYLSGRGSQRDICAKYEISKHGILQNWLRQYNNHEDFKQPNSGGGIYMAKGRETTLEERIEIVSYCISSNNDYGKTIEQYGVSYQQIYSWVKKYEKEGADGLVDRRGKRKEEASMSEVEKLRAQLKLKNAENLRLQMENELLKKLEALEGGRDID